MKMAKKLCLIVLACAAGCGTTIEPGHLGLLFDSHHGGLHPDVQRPGWHWLGAWGRMDDFDVTFSTRSEDIHTQSKEQLDLDLKVSIRFRPVVTELYDLDVEIGPNYYDEVLGPEFRSATRGVFARHPYAELLQKNEGIENEIEAEVRRRTGGKHIEVWSVTLEAVQYAPEIGAAVRSRLVGEQEAARKKSALEADALRQKLELEQRAEREKLDLQQKADREKLQTEAEIRQKEKEHRLAEEQAAIDKVQAETDSQTKLMRAKADAESIKLLARAHAEEKKAEAEHLTPLMVMMHAYDSLAQLGGDGTNIMLGDWSKVPNFLFPQFPGFMNGGHAANKVASTK